MAARSDGAPRLAACYRGGAPVTVFPDRLNDRAFRIQLDACPNASKPRGGEVSARIMEPGADVRMRADDIAEALSRGCSVLPGCCVGKRSPDCWTSQELFFVDIDNDGASAARGFDPLGEGAALRRARAYGLPLLMSYQTFKGTDEAAEASKQRFRLVFAAPAAITDRACAEAFARALVAVYPEADRSTGELNRIFYGTDKEVRVWQ